MREEEVIFFPSFPTLHFLGAVHHRLLSCCSSIAAFLPRINFTHDQRPRAAVIKARNYHIYYINANIIGRVILAELG